MNKLKAFKLFLVLNVLLSLNPVLASPVSAENESESRDYSNNIEYSISYSDDYSFAYLKINLNTDDDVYLDFTNNVDISNNIEQGKYTYDGDGKSYIFAIVRNDSYNFDTIVLANDENFDSKIGSKTISVDIADVSETGVVMNAYNTEYSETVYYSDDYSFGFFWDDTTEWSFCYWDENNVPNSVDDVNLIKIDDISNLEDLTDVDTNVIGFFDNKFNGNDYYVYKRKIQYWKSIDVLNGYYTYSDYIISVAFKDFAYKIAYNGQSSANPAKKYILFLQSQRTLG